MDWRTLIPQVWHSVLLKPSLSATWASIASALEEEYAHGVRVLPEQKRIFRALEMVAPQEVRVVILGQDPYLHPEQAMGLAFSVPEGIPLPPSLRNILVEVQNEYGGALPHSGDLSRWATQGVLLLNTIMTLREGQGLSHAKIGWNIITDTVVKAVSQSMHPSVFMLWGRHAQAKARVISGTNNLILTSAHPSPLSARRGFFGCGHFREANEWLLLRGEKEIAWV